MLPALFLSMAIWAEFWRPP